MISDASEAGGHEKPVKHKKTGKGVEESSKDKEKKDSKKRNKKKKKKGKEKDEGRPGRVEGSLIHYKKIKYFRHSSVLFFKISNRCYACA